MPPLIPPVPWVIASKNPSVEMVKMVMSCEALTLFKILSRVSFDMVSMPVPIRTMYFWPSMRDMRSSASLRASKMLVSENAAGM